MPHPINIFTLENSISPLLKERGSGDFVIRSIGGVRLKTEILIMINELKT